MTRPIIGYGEDALTYWAISEGLPQLLAALNCKAMVEECLAFYRPSFGRRNGFGEFDAILATPDRVFLIESKWHPPERSIPPSVVVKLREEQARRHLIWKSLWVNRPTTPHHNGILKTHIEFVFKRIITTQRIKAEAQDVCLYFVPMGPDIQMPKVRVQDAEGKQDLPSFLGVALSYPPLESLHGFIGLHSN